MERLFDKAVIIGVGLIGSSLARVLKANGLAGKISGVARSSENRQTALDLGIADEMTDDAAEAVRDADIVFICTPVGAVGKVAEKIAPVLKKGCIVTDVGSVKASVISAVQPFLPEDVFFVPAHPVAGTEKSGPQNGFAELFDGRWCILTPVSSSNEESVSLVRKVWETAGMKVEEMTPDRHDTIMALVSHLPHLIAYTIVGTAADLEEETKEEVIKFSAGGFRDFTRIAGSDPVMWRDIFLNNSEAVLNVLQRFTEDLTALQRAIRRKEGDTLEELFRRTRNIRRRVIEAHQDQPENEKLLLKKTTRQK